MAKPTKEMDRAIRIELLRARAALERESLVKDIASTSVSLKPGNFVKSWLPSFAQGNMSNILLQGFTLARRYPFISSSISAMLMGRGKRTGLFKLAGVGLLGWQAFKVWRNTHSSRYRDDL